VREFEFGPFLDLLPQSFNTLVGEEGINLSGGQKQMIALMRALYHRPQLLVLDEATTAMDRQSEKFVFRLLTSLREKIAVLIITHQLYSLRRVCDRMYIIESGKITGAGDHAGMLKTDNLYSRYWSDLVDR
jgi:ATP-binding cassette subfamily B protein